VWKRDVQPTWERTDSQDRIAKETEQAKHADHSLSAPVLPTLQQAVPEGAQAAVLPANNLAALLPMREAEVGL
jgi:hypothetical protein